MFIEISGHFPDLSLEISGHFPDLSLLGIFLGGLALFALILLFSSYSSVPTKLSVPNGRPLWIALRMALFCSLSSH
jgi:hypothetical protein